MKRISTIIIFTCLHGLPFLSGQALSFSHLNTSNGLSDNFTQCLVIDKIGFLWIGTADGLNVYDGYTVTNWNISSQTGLPSDTIRQLYCDSRNRIWIITPGHVAWSDEEKRFHPVQLPGKKERFISYAIFEIESYGVALFTSQGHYLFNEQKRELEKIEWIPESINGNDLNTAVPYTGDKIIYIYEQNIIVLDYRARKKIYEKSISHAVTACPYDNGTIAVATRHGEVHIIDITTQRQLKTYHVYNETDGKQSSPRISEMVKTPDGSLAIATLLSGLIMIDSTGKIGIYKHDPLNPASISGTMLYRVLAGNNGELITGALYAGVSICNINNKGSVCKKIFKGVNGNIFDGHINDMAEDKDGLMWLCASDRLICWDKRTNNVVFYKYFFNDPVLGPRNLEMRTICIDRKNRIWIGAIGAGVTLFNKQTGTFQLISKDTGLGKPIQNTYVNDIIEDSEGNIWACSFGGLYTIDPTSYHITTYQDHPLLKNVAEKIVISLFEDAGKKIWIGTQRLGIFCYDKQKKELYNYTTANGLLNNSGNSLTSDQYGNIYTAHLNGFSVIAPDGTIKSFSKANGMRYPRCEAILPDNNGYTWITNNKCLVRYSPVNNKLEYFEEHAGISTDGFRFDAVCKTKDGGMYFGTNRGINYFDPLQIKNYAAQLRVNIYQVLLPDSLIRFSHSPFLKTSYTKSNVQFYFTAINLSGSRNIAYEYMLEGFDKDWQKGIDIHFARYPSLPSGKYTFRVKASIDKINWIGADNKVNIQIIPPLWQRWWFVAISVIVLLAIVVIVVQFRINRIRYTERLKTIYNKKISETEMKALRAQMNPHFIFNSLNSINKYILKSDHTNASRYLTRFAKLIRLILDNSNSKEVPLSHELEALKLYIEMESLRFTNKFSYEIIVDESVSTDTLQVPPLIIQPYVENAIWHGLLHKESGGRLTITVKKTTDNMLQCIIEDNGVGRNRAKEMKSKSATANKSLGMKLTEERITMLNQYASLNASIEIDDLETSDGRAAGTKVILTIPI